MAKSQSRLESTKGYSERALKEHDRDAEPTAALKKDLRERLPKAEKTLNDMGFFETHSTGESMLREYNILCAKVLVELMEAAGKPSTNS